MEITLGSKELTTPANHINLKKNSTLNIVFSVIWYFMSLVAFLVTLFI